MNDSGSLSELPRSSPARGASERSLDDLLGALADSRRRYVLRALRENERPMTLASLAKAVADREHECPVTDVHHSTLSRVRISLYHAHVPKLADAGLVEYVRDADVVALAVDPELVDRYLSDDAESA